jgi:mycobactin peptide synthetase MbtE
MSRLMSDPTVTGLAAWLAAAGREPAGKEPAGQEPASAAAPAAPEQSPGAPLTPMQQSFVLRHLRSGEGTASHCLLSWTIRGSLDPGRLGRAVADVHGRHGYLSASYVVDDELRVVDSAAPAEFTRLDADSSGTAASLLEERLEAPFDLTRGPAWRAVLVSDRGSAAWLFGVAVHHVAFDGWSEHVVAREISVAYAAAGQADGACPARAVPTPAETYRVLEEIGAAVDLAGQRAYWARTLAGMPPMTWPVAPDPDDQEPRSAQYPLTEDELAGIARIARLRGVTLLTLLLEGAYEAIYACTGQDDLGIGVPVSSRGAEVLQRPVGCLIDTMCVRARPPGIAAAVSGALANSDLPFAEVVRELAPARTGRHPLYQVIAAVQDSPPPLLSLAGCPTEIRDQPDLPWPNAELVIELFTTPGRPGRLAVSRDPAVLDAKTFTGIADGVANWLHLAVGASR